MSIEVFPVGYVHSSRRDRSDDGWDEVESYIELTEDFSTETLVGLEEFSHVLVVFSMHEVDKGSIVTGSRRPRNRGDLPRAGIFAQRGSGRPNRLGVTVSRLIKIEDTRLYLRGLDAIDGTPVLDLKPWMIEFGPRGEVHQPEWVSNLMKHYWRKAEES